MRFVFSADLHGTEKQYETVFQIADNLGLPLIIGGDLCPKDRERRTIRGQADWIRNFFKPLCQKATINIYVIMGNDDFKDNLKILYEMENDLDNFCILGDKPIDIDGVEFVGYPYVPLTPFKYKDWDKKDVYGDEREYTAKGVRSQDGELVEYEHDPDSMDTIDKDLKKWDCKGVWIVHSPPYDTNLDITVRGEHVGSKAIRKAIERVQPLLTLHGHIHETVERSGKWTDSIGETLCMTSGNHPHTDKAWYLIVDTEDISKTERKQA